MKQIVISGIGTLNQFQCLTKLHGTLNQFQCLTKLHTPVPEVTRAERTEND